MNGNVKQNVSEKSIWLRGLYMLLFAFFYSIAKFVLFAVVVFQFLLKLITGNTNDQLLKLGHSLALYAFQILQFLNFNSEQHPYPFSEWPEPPPVQQLDECVEDNNEDEPLLSEAVSEPVQEDTEAPEDSDKKPTDKKPD